jgi:hypothetical protein
MVMELIEATAYFAKGGTERVSSAAAKIPRLQPDLLTSPQRPVSIASSRRVSVWVTSSSVRKYSASRTRWANSNCGRLSHRYRRF